MFRPGYPVQMGWYFYKPLESLACSEAAHECSEDLWWLGSRLGLPLKAVPAGNAFLFL